MRLKTSLVGFSLPFLIAPLWASCGGGPVTTEYAVDGGGDGVVVLPDGNVIVDGKGVGEACAVDTDCRTGLACTNQTCEPGHTFAAGAPCLISGECQDGLQCVGGVCATAGTGELGAPCTDDTGCVSGLRCGIVGFGAQCVTEGTADVGGACTTSSDCFGGLLCAGDEGCAPALSGQTAFGMPSSPSVTCAEPSQGEVEAYFEVPGAADTDPTGDFFRLPFPNDIRIKNGSIDLTGFPTPGVSPLVGFDPVKPYVDAVTRNENGWGTEPSVLFRFSGPVDYDTIRGVEGSVYWLDITDPQNVLNGGLRWAASSQRSTYICQDWLGVRRPDGMPLDPGHTYVVYVSTVMRDKNGLAIKRSPQFEAMLADTPPSDPALAAAYDAYMPFRTYLTAAAVDPATILNATVITTGQVRSPMADLAAAVRQTPVPSISNWVLCDGNNVSPCPQADGDRACGQPNADYDEYHALVSLPIFQSGTAPYLQTGGGIDASAGPVRTEQVCMALTVPKGTMPSGGWPLAVFGHGTGGSFRSFIRPEVAGALAHATTATGQSFAMAVLGYDEVEHGPRRGDSTESPDNLFFNFANPDAARGNPLQGAADVISVGRAAAALSVTAADTGGADIAIDPSQIVYFGHSQGSTQGSLGLPYANEYRAAVFSGNGASLMHALLSKKSPVDIADALPLVLGDRTSKGSLPNGDMHPVLTLLQQWIDPADPLNFAKTIAVDPASNMNPKSVFQTYGLGDTYSPPLTMQMYALAAELKLAQHDPSVTTPDEIGSLAELPVPMSGNRVINNFTLTLAVREYAPPAGSDGHFVVFDVPSANADAVRFLAGAANGDVPVVGQ